MKINSIETSYDLEKARLIVECPAEELDALIALIPKVDKEADYEITIKKKRKGRSPDANSYYWSLIGRLSAVLRQSKEEVHNIILARYGVDWVGDDGKLTYVMMADDDRYLAMTEQHFRPTSRLKFSIREQKNYRWYILLKPSHLYDTGEFSHLLDGLIDECHEVGIQTENREYIEELKRTWKN